MYLLDREPRLFFFHAQRLSCSLSPWLFHRQRLVFLVSLINSIQLGRSTYASPTVPLGLAAVALQSSIYDVPGGYRAVMFDRFSGVKDQARN